MFLAFHVCISWLFVNLRPGDDGKKPLSSMEVYKEMIAQRLAQVSSFLYSFTEILIPLLSIKAWFLCSSRASSWSLRSSQWQPLHPAPVASVAVHTPAAVLFALEQRQNPRWVSAPGDRGSSQENFSSVRKSIFHLANFLHYAGRSHLEHWTHLPQTHSPG